MTYRSLIIEYSTPELENAIPETFECDPNMVPVYSNNLTLTEIKFLMESIYIEHLNTLALIAKEEEQKKKKDKSRTAEDNFK